MDRCMDSVVPEILLTTDDYPGDLSRLEGGDRFAQHVV